MIRILPFFLFLLFFSQAESITPYKFQDSSNLPSYTIPPENRFSIIDPKDQRGEIVYYFSAPTVSYFPIAIVCGGSSDKENVDSIIHLHRYFLAEFWELGAAVLTVEQQGIDGQKIDKSTFFQNYTRTNRLQDHRRVLEHLKENPPQGWSGKIILFGVSEGGPLVISLTEEFQDEVIATVNWSGAGDWPWREELWSFLEGIEEELPWHMRLRTYLPSWFPYSMPWPHDKKTFDAMFKSVIDTPSTEGEFFGMTHKYHADADAYPTPSYEKIKTPFLAVAGAKDTIIQSADEFVRKAKVAGMDITYHRVEDMDHYVRRRPDVVAKTFEWIKSKIGFAP